MHAHAWAYVYYASEWIIRLVMLVYVPQRRTSAAARSWLLLIFLLPWPGLILYYLIGRPYVPHRRIELQKRVSELIRSALDDVSPTEPEAKVPQPFDQTVKLGQNLGDFRMRPGNNFELLPVYDESINRLIADIDAAREHVHLLYYIWGVDETGNRVADAVMRAAKRGVQCRVLIDSAGSNHARRQLAPRLREAGVEVVPLLPAGLIRRNAARFDLRNHRKIAVIDGRVAYTGSQNIINANFKPRLVYEELVARITGPVVRELQMVLLADYFAETRKPIEAAKFFPEVEASGTTSTLALPSGPSYPHLNNLDVVISLVHAASKRIVLTSPYFIPSDPLMQAMLAAALRGVEVHLINCKQIDQWLVGLAQRSYYDQLLEGGIHVHLYEPAFLHTKLLSFDDEVALLGSSNMDIRSFQLNEEISLMVYDPKLLSRLREIEARYLANSEALTLKSWRERTWGTRFLQNIARMADSLL